MWLTGSHLTGVKCAALNREDQSSGGRGIYWRIKEVI